MGRLVVLPARVAVRSPLARPFRGRAERLAETGRSAEVDARRRIETVAGEVLATPETRQVVNGVLAGALPEVVARSLIEHRVVERVVGEALASPELEGEIVSAGESEHVERLVVAVLESPTLERLLSDALESRLTLELTDRLMQSDAFGHALTRVLAGPEVRVALKGQSRSLAAEIITALRTRLVSLDDAAERGPRRLFHRPVRPQPSPVAASSVPEAGIATRGVALAVDAALLAIIFLTGTAVLDLVVSLFWKPRPAVAVGAVMAAAWLLLEVVYFVGFWSTAGQTPGMRLLHLRVQEDGGSAPGVGRSLLRLVGLALAILLLLTGFLPVLIDDRRRALQDFLAGTIVVYHEDAQLS